MSDIGTTIRDEYVGPFQIINFERINLIITGREVDGTFSIGWSNDRGNISKHFTKKELIEFLTKHLGEIKDE